MGKCFASTFSKKLKCYVILSEKIFNYKTMTVYSKISLVVCI
ncbi:hypothetical protein KsCSTR_33030 [Candidatus Kuenenia stuttgartiensis]|uniref:Uncharacterized protein n=1 Tax=Kuenenia stuttgartiensis TaxID=174633 RepID=A0A6G7GTJ5_KUEST|nr:hypothetical protein KsCSTR_33030 [Candidatus Kuenenia stuttgartiensis]